MKILVINAGSSSLKYQLIEMDNTSVIAKGIVERIGAQKSTIRYEYFVNGEKQRIDETTDFPDHLVAFKRVASFLTDAKVGVVKNVDEIQHIGHRVVHGGEKFSTTQKVSAQMLDTLRELIPLAPLHNPANITGIEAAMAIFPKAENYAIFDTSFHQTLPAKAYRYAIPNEFYEKNGIRVYGFHGTSHKYVDARTRRYFNNPNMKIITIHLGNGASMAAINEKGESIDTTLGFGPNEGLAMGTRSGSIDSSVIFYLHSLGYSIEKISQILNKESGMLGLTGYSDSRDVTELYEKNDPNGILCMDLYAYRVQKYIGAYMAALNGVDAIVFTAGIGENSSEVRELSCQNLEALGIKIDVQKNIELNRPSDIVEVQAADSRVKIVVVATNEELQIANEIVALVK